MGTTGRGPDRAPPISDDAADQLLLDNLPATAASDATLTRLRSSAGGSPFYLIELARSVADERAANTRSDIYPASIERLLAARIDNLPMSGRQLIRDASVLGASFSRALASKILAASRAERGRDLVERARRLDARRRR